MAKAKIVNADSKNSGTKTVTDKKKKVLVVSSSESEEESDVKTPHHSASSDSDDSDEHQSDKEEEEQEDEEMVEEEEEEEDLIEEVKEKRDHDRKRNGERAPLQQFPLEMKFELLKEVRRVNCCPTASYTMAMKKLNWSKIEIEGYTKEELQDCFNIIISSLQRIRTLDEMISAYERDYKRIEVKHSAKAPRRPLNPSMEYFVSNIDTLKKLFEEEHPGESSNTMKINSFAMDRFKNKLSEEERAEYIQKYETKMKEYLSAKKEFYKENPELAPSRFKKRKPKEPRPPKEPKAEKKEPKERKVKEPKVKRERKKKDLPYISPFQLFQEKLQHEGRRINVPDARSMYKVLSDEEKMVFIRQLLDMDTDREKQYSKYELGLLKNASGEPKKPHTAYNYFVHELSASLGQPNALLKTAGAKWREMDANERKPYEEKSQRDLAKWQEDMKAWIAKKPKEEQAEIMAKHGFLQGTDRKGAKKRKESMLSSDVKAETAVKKRKTIDSYFSRKSEESEESRSQSGSLARENENEKPSSVEQAKVSKNSPKKKKTDESAKVAISDLEPLVLISPLKEKKKNDGSPSKEKKSKGNDKVIKTIESEEVSSQNSSPVKGEKKRKDGSPSKEKKSKCNDIESTNGKKIDKVSKIIESEEVSSQNSSPVKGGKKKKKFEDDEDSTNETTKKANDVKKAINFDEPSGEKKKKKKTDANDMMSFLEQPSPKKQKLKDLLEDLGPYPSLSHAHYFMTQEYSGKPSKVGKAYNKLDTAERRRMKRKTDTQRNVYMSKLRSIVEKNSKYAEKIKEFHEKNKREQIESISWHKATDTDESSDSDSSDSD